jgi:hypothetical protein
MTDWYPMSRAPKRGLRKYFLGSTAEWHGLRILARGGDMAQTYIVRWVYSESNPDDGRWLTDHRLPVLPGRWTHIPE